MDSEPTEYADVARAETERGELVLRSRREGSGPEVLELRANGVFVMDTAETSSERALASAALELVDSPATVLVGGLGLGFTMREVLADQRVERCTVVEIEQDLVDWMRDGTIPYGPAMLADERLTVVVNDVALAFAEAGEVTYDLVLLDVDNGPGYLVHDANALLYRAPFLRDVRRVTRQALVIWSAAVAPELESALGEVFDDVRALAYDVQLGERSETYWLYIARPASSSR
jgi:spermidine synthase